jgi:hypothetical protein
MNCHRVLPSLFVGPDPGEGEDLKALGSLKITAILSLQTNDDLRDRGFEWEEKATRAVGLDFLNLPVTGFRFRRPSAQASGVRLSPRRDAQGVALGLRPLHRRRQPLAHGGGFLPALVPGLAPGAAHPPP